MRNLFLPSVILAATTVAMAIASPALANQTSAEILKASRAAMVDKIRQSGQQVIGKCQRTDIPGKFYHGAMICKNHGQGWGPYLTGWAGNRSDLRVVQIEAVKSWPNAGKVLLTGADVNGVSSCWFENNHLTTCPDGSVEHLTELLPLLGAIIDSGEMESWFSETH
jgi:hypothetical protein